MADLHVILTYNPNNQHLIAEFYQGAIPNSSLPDPFIINANYTFFRNGVQLVEIINGDRVEIDVSSPICNDVYSVVVSYTANGNIFPPVVSSTVVGIDYIFNNDMIIREANSLILVPPTGVVPTTIQWAYNYHVFIPSDSLIVDASLNGIYEVKFVANGTTYIAAIEVNDSGNTNTFYIKILGNDGSIYGTFGTPRIIESLLFIPVFGNQPFRYKVYINNMQVSTNSFLSLVNLTNAFIYVIITDCCDLTANGNTVLLSCGING